MLRGLFDGGECGWGGFAVLCGFFIGGLEFDVVLFRRIGRGEIFGC